MSETPTSAPVPAASASAFDARLGASAQGATERPVAAPSEAPAISPEPAEPGTIRQTRAADRLSQHIRRTFRIAAETRAWNGVNEKLRQSKLALEARYDASDLADIVAAGAPAIYFGYDGVKFRAAVANLSEIEAIGQGRCWTLAPTPWPDVPRRVKDAALQLTMEDFNELLRLAVALVRSGRRKPEELKQILPPPAHMELRAADAAEEARRKEKEAAEKACERMEAKIDDQFMEGGFERALQDTISYTASRGTCVVYGPAPRARAKVVGDDTPEGGRRIKTEIVTEPEFEAINPEDCYPAPGARDIDDGPFVRKVRYQPSELAAFARASKGKDALPWREDAINKILAAFPNGGVVEDEWIDWSLVDLGNSEETEALSGRSCQIEGLQFFGEARGGDLLQCGITKDAKGGEIREDDYYEVEAVTILDFLVYCRVTEPEIGRPLSKFVYEENTGSWWGDGVFDLVRAPQRVLNATVRAIVVNAAQSAGPIVVVDTARFEGDLTIRPWKRFDKKPVPAGFQADPNPFEVHNIPSTADKLLLVQSNARQAIDEFSMIPSVSYGQTAGAPAGLTRTASLYSMVTESSTKSLKQVARGYDRSIRRVVMLTYAWNMLYAKDESLKLGDVRCNPSGVLGYLVVEQNYNKLLQFFQMTANPTDMQLIQTTGRAFLLREIAKRLGLNPDRVIPSPEKLEESQRLNELKEEFALAQQKANYDATVAGTEGVEARNAAEGGTPPSAPVQDTAEDTAATPSPAPGTNARRAQAAAARRIASGGSGEGGVSAAAEGTMRQTMADPRRRAAQGAASAATKRGGG